MSQLLKHLALATLVAPLAGCSSAPGSCTFDSTSASGYTYCEDFLGSEFNFSAAQNTCASESGIYSSSACPRAGALGTCANGGGTADDYQFTYYAGSGAAPPTSTTLESACGVAGGVYTP